MMVAFAEVTVDEKVCVQPVAVPEPLENEPVNATSRCVAEFATTNDKAVEAVPSASMVCPVDGVTVPALPGLNTPLTTTCCWKVRVQLWFAAIELSVTVLFATSTVPQFALLKRYPELGVAVSVTVEPSTTAQPLVEQPPPEALTVPPVPLPDVAALYVTVYVFLKKAVQVLSAFIESWNGFVDPVHSDPLVPDQ